MLISLCCTGSHVLHLRLVDGPIGMCVLSTQTESVLYVVYMMCFSIVPAEPSVWRSMACACMRSVSAMQHFVSNVGWGQNLGVNYLFIP